MRNTAIALFVLFISVQFVNAQDSIKGWQLGGNMGYYIPSNTTAIYYNGSNNGGGLYGGDSTNLQRVLFNRYIKKEIRDAIGGYDYILGELPLKIRYTPALTFGFIAKYQFSESSAAFIQFNYTKLYVSDVFTLITDKYNSGFTSPYYEVGEIAGTEERINLDIGANIYFPTEKTTCPYLEMGINILDTEALEAEIRIRDLAYDISSPYNRYYNIKEGGIGIGGFIGGGIQSNFNEQYTLNLGVNLYISKIALPGFDQHQPNFLILARLLF